jgi:hypothetical protein
VEFCGFRHQRGCQRQAGAAGEKEWRGGVDNYEVKVVMMMAGTG